jgi:hypothetical protein
MSLALGDINAESLKALAAQGGAEFDEFVDRIKAMAIAAEDHGEAVIDAVETKTQGDIAEDINAVTAGLRDVLAPVITMLDEIIGRGLVITVALAPAKGTQ